MNHQKEIESLRSCISYLSDRLSVLERKHETTHDKSHSLKTPIFFGNLSTPAAETKLANPEIDLVKYYQQNKEIINEEIEEYRKIKLKKIYPRYVSQNFDDDTCKELQNGCHVFPLFSAELPAIDAKWKINQTGIITDPDCYRSGLVTPAFIMKDYYPGSIKRTIFYTEHYDFEEGYHLNETNVYYNYVSKGNLNDRDNKILYSKQTNSSFKTCEKDGPQKIYVMGEIDYYNLEKVIKYCEKMKDGNGDEKKHEFYVDAGICEVEFLRA